MILETSALVSILLDEPESVRLTRAASTANRRWLSVANYVEASVVLERRFGSARLADVDRLCTALQISIRSVTPRMGDLAVQAHVRYGLGSGHPAGLNFGDCFAYALAMDSGQPLLFVGHDFARTDVPAAAW